MPQSVELVGMESTPHLRHAGHRGMAHHVKKTRSPSWVATLGLVDGLATEGSPAADVMCRRQGRQGTYGKSKSGEKGSVPAPFSKTSHTVWGGYLGMTPKNMRVYV